MTFTVEKNTRFSQSKLWDLQKQYFTQQGIHAWNKQVPFYITSNPYIAHSYAEVVIHFIRDLVNTHQINTEKPLYILELGAGPGKFSYYFLRSLSKLRKQLGYEQLPFAYVMSDVTHRNPTFWQQQAQLAPFIAQGLLDFAIVDLSSQPTIHLQHANITLDTDQLCNPLIVFANYIFDTIAHDIFHVDNKQLYVGLTTLEAESEQTISIDSLVVKHQFKPITTPYYQEPALDTILQHYVDHLSQGSFCFPLQTFRTLDYLLRLSQHQMLLISTDKGYTHLSDIEGRDPPTLVTHGSFSMMVNFHAIGQFFQHHQGECWHQQPREGIKTSVYLAGKPLSHLPNTSYAIEKSFDQFSPGDFFIFHQHLANTKDQCEPKTVLSHLRFSRWDPRIFNLFNSELCQCIIDAPKNVIAGFIQGINELLENLYEMPNEHRHYFQIALFLQALALHDKALVLYQKVAVHDKNFHLHYNMGLCYHALAQYPAALEQFENALALDRGSKKAREWVLWIKERSRSDMETAP